MNNNSEGAAALNSDASHVLYRALALTYMAHVGCLRDGPGLLFVLSELFRSARQSVVQKHEIHSCRSGSLVG